MMTVHTRRKFLGAAATPHLIGTATARGPFLPETAEALKRSGSSVVIPTHEYAGDIEERLEFPNDWDLRVHHMAGWRAQPLSVEQIRSRISNPIGARPLVELAAGKKSAVVTFDDLSRPTPTYQVAQFVVDELRRAGVPESGIVLLASFGAHRSLEQDEAALKVGRELLRRYAWINHNVHDSLTDVGETRFKNRIRVNRQFVAADIRVTIGGVKVHGIAGYGGGAKSVLPGVAGLDCINFNHRKIAAKNATSGECKVFKNEVRLDMEDAARLAKVDFTVQLVYDGRRRTCGVFAGDIVQAHHAACRMANAHYRTEAARDADVVVANAYPQNSQATKGLAWIGSSVREGGTGLLIVQHPQCVSAWHYLYQPGYEGGANYWEKAAARRAAPSRYQLIVYSQYLQKTQMNLFPPGTLFADTWNSTVQLLLSRHPKAARVAVYPYSCIQHHETGLDA